MEKQGKVKLIKYNEDSSITTKHCIISMNDILVPLIEFYDGTILVKTDDIPIWLVDKLRKGKVKHNDNVIVTVKDNGEPLIEDNEAVIELAKTWNSMVEEIFEERYTKTQVIGFLTDLENTLAGYFERKSKITDTLQSRQQFLDDKLIEYGLIKKQL